MAIYIYNIVDGLVDKPAGGYRETKETDILQDLNISTHEKVIGIEYTLTF